MFETSEKDSRFFPLSSRREPNLKEETGSIESEAYADAFASSCRAFSTVCTAIRPQAVVVIFIVIGSK